MAWFFCQWENGASARKNLNLPPNIVETPLNTLMNLLTSPNMAILKILKDINWAGPVRSVLRPTVPIPVISEPVLTRTSFEDFVKQKFMQGQAISYTVE